MEHLLALKPDQDKKIKGRKKKKTAYEIPCFNVLPM